MLLGVIASAPLVARALSTYRPDDLQRSVIQDWDVLHAIREGDQALALAAMRSHILAARYVVLHGVSVS